MSAPRETPCGRVKIYEPTKPGGYWRLEFYEHNRRRQTTAGKTFEDAGQKVKEILARLDADTQPEGEKVLNEFLEAYFAWAHEEWTSEQYYVETKRSLENALKPYLRLRCRQLDGRRLTGICNAATTAGVAKQQRSRLRAMLTWGKKSRYFTLEQSRCLNDYLYVPNKEPIKKPSRKSQTRTAGEGAKFVTKDEVPLHGQVRRLAEELQKLLWYGELMVEFDGATGLRLGELCALSTDHLHLRERMVEVEWQVSDVPLPDGGRLCRPKGNKVRTAVFPVVSETGYPLMERLRDRVEEVETEYQAGRNPHRLLFPAKKGGYWWKTSFTNDFFTPAAEAAGWERLSWVENGKVRFQWKHTMHSLRHRMARDAIDIWKFTPAELTAVGGWESMGVVWEMYYGQSKDLLKSALKKTGKQPGKKTPRPRGSTH
jgi:integrase